MAAFSIAGLGSYLPPRVVCNDEVGALVALAPARIHEVLGVAERHWVRSVDSPRPMPGQSVSDLAAEAVNAALEDAGVKPGEVDTLIVVSTTAERVSPPVDYLVRLKLGMGELFGCTVHSACTGMFRAAAMVESFMLAERTELAVVVAVDALSPYFVFGSEVPKDMRMSFALYGDGAAAFVAVREQTGLPLVEGITTVMTGSQQCPGIVFNGPFAQPAANGNGASALGYHDFRRVLEKGGRLTRQAADHVLENIGKSFADVDHVLIHQSTGRLKEKGAAIGLPAEKMHVNIEKVGNTVSPSILILLDELKRSETFRAGDLVLVHSAESATWSYGGLAISWQ